MAQRWPSRQQPALCNTSASVLLRPENASHLPTSLLPPLRGQKHYVVFVARISPEVRASWQPHLNEEHSAWRWFPLAELTAGNTLLHPVVELALMHDPWRRPVLAAVGGQAG